MRCAALADYLNYCPTYPMDILCPPDYQQQLQAQRPDLVDALNKPFLSSNPITFDE